MKRRIFLVCLFYCFFRLPVYKSIAAIFWQSASYVSCILLIFGLIFANFDDCFVLLSQMDIKRTLLLEQFLDNNWLQFCGYEAFLVEKYDKKGQ